MTRKIPRSGLATWTADATKRLLAFEPCYRPSKEDHVAETKTLKRAD